MCSSFRILVVISPSVFSDPWIELMVTLLFELIRDGFVTTFLFIRDICAPESTSSDVFWCGLMSNFTFITGRGDGVLTLVCLVWQTLRRFPILNFFRFRVRPNNIALRIDVRSQ